MIEALFRYLPRGGSLPSAAWVKRHKAMVILLWAHVPAIFAVGVATGHATAHVALESSALVAFALAAMTERLHRNWRMVATSLGLLTASALLVHFTEGVIEMHFHFFVIVAAVTLYQAWLPFLVAIGYVVGQHGVMGAIDASSVYNHAAAVANPWKWAFVHGMFIMGESVTLLVAWRLNEDSRAAAAAEYESRLEEEKARRAAQEAFGRIFDNSGEGIYESTAAGHIMTANPALARILGYDSPDAMTGVEVGNHYADVSKRTEFLAELEMNDRVAGFEFEAKRLDGSSVWLSNNATAVRDEQGRLISVQGMIEDISKRKEAELKKEDLEAQLRQAQKMEAVGQLAGGVAHDFNNLLSIIQNYARFSMEGLESDDLRAQDLQEVLKASSRGADLVRQLMAFSRREVIVGTSLDLNEIVRELGKMLHRTLGEDVVLSAELGDDLWSVEADAGHLEQILMNLVLNARDALSANGEVTITTSNYVVREDEEQVMLKPGSYVRLQVRDNGSGIPDDVKERIFEPFFTTKGVGSGTGLGLATVYGIAEHWNGHVTVTSEVGVGTEFSIYLPAIASARTNPEVVTGPNVEEEAVGRILVVEDEESVLELVRRILHEHGYDVVAASSAAEAIERLRQSEEKLDLCISDMVMPDTSGHELADVLERECPDIPVVFMSGYSADVLAKHGSIDSDRILPKPFSPEQLLAHVQKGLRPRAAA